MEAKGIRSVRSRVTNISRYSSISPESFVHILQKHFKEEKQAEEYTLSETDTESIQRLAASRYDTWEWNYGRSKECKLIQKGRVEGCGTVEVRICLDGSRIQSLSFSGDFLTLSELDVLESAFLGREPSEKDYRELLKEIDVSAFIRGLNNEELLKILLS
jgi:lipoate-protein ligase A